MSWRDKKQAASFRGVAFEVLRDSAPAGQRTQVHEYPQRDTPLVEALGKRTKEVRVTAFVAGDDCLSQRDALLEVIEQPGSGELILPWTGSITATCIDCNYSHDRRTQGMVQFELVFVEGEAEPSYPVAGADAASTLNSAADAVQTSALERFTAALEGIDLSQISLDAVLTPIGQVLEVVQDVYGSVSGVLGSAQRVFDSVMAGPGAFADAVFGIIGGARSLFGGFYSRAQGVMSLFGLADRADAVQRLGGTLLPSGAANRVFVAAVRSLVQDAVAVDAVRGTGALPSKTISVTRAGQVAVDGMKQGGVAVDSGTLGQVVDGLTGVDRVELPVADDVLQVRDGVSESLWSLAEQSPTTHYEVIAQARVAATRNLTAVARQGDVLTRYNNPAPVPALVLAYRRYGDAARVGDIVARNGVRHPGFVPATELLLPRG
ncbi:DNA circularization protein [Alcaligenes aquatilis]|uniref:DNA circularization protein n=1 Tax=Alcaligenes aquatilis TaxID=323284 RepID=UPI003F929B08